MFIADHHPPHFHAAYGEYEAVITIAELGLLAGGLPPRAMGMVIEWAAAHRSELLSDWERAQRQLPLEKIEPLQ